MRTRLSGRPACLTFAALLTAAGLCACGAYEARVRSAGPSHSHGYIPGRYSAIGLSPGKSGWGKVAFLDRCLPGGALQLHLHVREGRDPDERVSMVVLGNALGPTPWAEGDVLAVLEGGVEDAALVVPCASEEVEWIVIGFYPDPDGSGQTSMSFRAAFLDRHGQVAPDAYPPDEWWRSPVCHPVECPSKP